MTLNNDKIAFIVGFPRSGTTLLAGLLNSHGSITCTPETQYYCQALRHQRFQTNKKSENELIKIYQAYRLKDLSLSEKVVSKAAAESNSSLLTFYKNLLNAYTQNKDDWLIEKTPDHLRYIFRIKKDFPNAKFILIVRDPRGSIASLLKNNWNNKGTKLAALEYSHQINLINRFQHNHSVTTIKYEDLVQTPENSLKTICKTLELPFKKTMLSNAGAKEIIPDRELGWKSNSLNKVSQSSLNKWEKDLTNRQIKVIERSCHNLMVQHDYTRKTSPSSFEFAHRSLERIFYFLARKTKNLIDGEYNRRS